jgi:hypothetical protein
LAALRYDSQSFCSGRRALGLTQSKPVTAHVALGVQWDSTLNSLLFRGAANSEEDS